MTIAAQMPMAPVPTGPQSDDGVSWRALRSGLWAARRDGHHLGTIEKGRRFLASDADSEPIGVFRTFREAQAAVVDPTSPRGSTRPRASVAPAFVVAGLVTAALTSVAGWVWMLLLP